MRQKQTIKRTVEVDVILDKEGNVLGEFPSPTTIEKFVELGGANIRRESQVREMSMEDFMSYSKKTGLEEVK